jgi:hypothetical protein
MYVIKWTKEGIPLLESSFFCGFYKKRAQNTKNTVPSPPHQANIP